MITKNYFIPLICTIGLFATGCGKSEISQYTVKKEVKPTATAPMSGSPGNQSGNQPAPAAGSAIKYDTPEGWSDIGGSGMRVAAFTAGAEDSPVSITVIPLPGTAGTLLSNVNRWRGQVGLEATTEADLELTDVSMADSTAKLVELVGAEQSMTSAILQRDGQQWFFKMMGPPAEVKTQRAAFDAFLQSVSFPR